MGIRGREMSRIAKFMGPTWGPPGSCRPQMGPILAPWTLLSGVYCYHHIDTEHTVPHGQRLQDDAKVTYRGRDFEMNFLQ